MRTCSIYSIRMLTFFVANNNACCGGTSPASHCSGTKEETEREQNYRGKLSCVCEPWAHFSFFFLKWKFISQLLRLRLMLCNKLQEMRNCVVVPAPPMRWHTRLTRAQTKLRWRWAETQYGNKHTAQMRTKQIIISCCLAVFLSPPSPHLPPPLLQLPN